MNFQSERATPVLFWGTLTHVLLLAPVLKSWIVLFSLLSMSIGFVLRFTQFTLPAIAIRRIIQVTLLLLVMTQHTPFQFARTIAGMSAIAASCFFLTPIAINQGMKIIFCNLILLAAGCLRFHASWSPALVIADVILMVVTTQHIMTLNRNRRDLLSSLFRSFRLSIPIVLLMTAIFRFFPEFLPASNFGVFGGSGFGSGELLQPGVISKVALSSRKSFSVEFSKAKPPSFESLYFKGQVLETNEGLTWRSSKDSILTRIDNVAVKNEVFTAAEAPIRYKIRLEPRYSGYVFTLDHPISVIAMSEKAPADILSRGNGVYWSPVLDRRLTLSATSIPRQSFSVSVKPQAQPSTLDPLTALRRADLLAVPESIQRDARIALLVTHLQSQGSSLSSTLTALWNHFAQKGYRYSLEPGEMKATDLGSFLNDRKSGFCEHYAAASANLLRLAGFPARIAVGFLGGDWNPVNQKLVVRDSHAHAWVEVWDQDTQSWLRFDPTAAVAPDAMAELMRQLFVSDWEWWRWSLAYLAAWSDHFENFGETGIAFLSRIEEQMPDPNIDHLLVALAGLALIIALSKLLRSRQSKTKNIDRLGFLFDEFRTTIADKGFPVEVSETPRALSARFEVLKNANLQIVPDDHIQFLSIFMRARYEGSISEDEAQFELKRILKKIKSEKLSSMLTTR